MSRKTLLFSIVWLAVCALSTAVEVDQNGMMTGSTPVTTHTLEELTQPMIGESGAIIATEQVERKAVWFGSMPDEVVYVPLAEYDSYLRKHGGSPTPLAAPEEGDQSDGMVPLWGNDVLIHGPEAGMASPSVAVADNGDIYAAVERNNGTAQAVYVHRSTDGGISWSEWGSVTSATSDRRRPQILINDFGTMDYVFVAYDIESSTGEFNVWTVRSALAASASWTYASIDATSGTVDTRPAIDEDLYSSYYIYATFQRDAGSDLGDIQFSRSIDSAGSWEAPYSIATSSVGEYRDPEIGYGFGGSVYVTWWLDGATGYDDAIRLMKGTNRVPDSASWGFINALTSNSDGIDDREPTVASVNNGQNVEVLFRRLNANYDIHEFYSSDGATTWSDKHFASGGTDNRTRWPRMAVEYSTDTIYMTWRVSFTDPERLAVYSSTTPGTWNPAPGTISDTGNEPSYAYPPAITGKYASSADQPWLVWLKYDGIYSLYYDGAEEPIIDTLAAAYTCLPPSGVVPFTTMMTVTMDNLYSGQTRRFAAHIDAALANGSNFPNWRAGYTNVTAGNSFLTSWPQYIPALGTLIGANAFTLVAEDVTPAPFNQPPYPPAGDTATAGCTVTALAP